MADVSSQRSCILPNSPVSQETKTSGNSQSLSHRLLLGKSQEQVRCEIMLNAGGGFTSLALKIGSGDDHNLIMTEKSSSERSKNLSKYLPVEEKTTHHQNCSNFLLCSKAFPRTPFEVQARHE